MVFHSNWTVQKSHGSTQQNKRWRYSLKFSLHFTLMSRLQNWALGEKMKLIILTLKDSIIPLASTKTSPPRQILFTFDRVISFLSHSPVRLKTNATNLINQRQRILMVLHFSLTIFDQSRRNFNDSGYIRREPNWKRLQRDVWELCWILSDFWGRDVWRGQMRIDFAPEASAPLRVPLPRRVPRCLEHRKYCATEAVASPASRRPLRTLKYATNACYKDSTNVSRPRRHRCFLPFDYSSVKG